MHAHARSACLARLPHLSEAIHNYHKFKRLVNNALPSTAMSAPHPEQTQSPPPPAPDNPTSAPQLYTVRSQSSAMPDAPAVDAQTPPYLTHTNAEPGQNLVDKRHTTHTEMGTTHSTLTQSSLPDSLSARSQSAAEQSQSPTLPDAPEVDAQSPSEQRHACAEPGQQLAKQNMIPTVIELTTHHENTQSSPPASDNPTYVPEPYTERSQLSTTQDASTASPDRTHTSAEPTPPVLNNPTSSPQPLAGRPQSPTLPDAPEMAPKLR